MSDDGFSTIHSVYSSASTFSAASRACEELPTSLIAIENHMQSDIEIGSVLNGVRKFMKGTAIHRELLAILSPLLNVPPDHLYEEVQPLLEDYYQCRNVWDCIADIILALKDLRISHEQLLSLRQNSCANIQSARSLNSRLHHIYQPVQETITQAVILIDQVFNLRVAILDEFGEKLKTDADFVDSLLQKIRHRVTSTYLCYVSLDKVQHWCSEAMTLVGRIPVERGLSPDALELMVESIRGFLHEQSTIDDLIFDQISKEARSLSNRRLAAQCKNMRHRYCETKKLLDYENDRVTQLMNERNETVSCVYALSAPNTPILTLRSQTRPINRSKRRSRSLDESMSTEEQAFLAQATQEQYNDVFESTALDKNKQYTLNNLSESPPSLYETEEIKTHDYFTKEQTNIPIDNYDRNQTHGYSSDSERSEDNSSECSSLSPSHTTIRGDSFLPVSDVTIPLDSVGQSNYNNEHTLTSPTLEHGQVYQPIPAIRTSLLKPQTVPSNSPTDHDTSKLSPIVPKRQDLLMVKRRSFHGFDNNLPPAIAQYNRSKQLVEDSMKRLSSGSNLSISETSEVETPSYPGHTQTLNRRSHDHRYSHHSNIPNSHLRGDRVIPALRCKSMADLRLTESELKSRITLAHIMDELIQTEKDYVLSLQLVINSYIPEILKDDVPQALRGKRGAIFGNIEQLYGFHSRYLLQDLIECENQPFRISKVLLDHKEGFMKYALYNKNKPLSDRLMKEEGCAYFKRKQLEIGDKLDLSSYLLKPVQRLGKYALIVKQIIKECPQSSSEYNQLTAAEEMIKFCLQHGNNLLAIDLITGADVDLHEHGILLLQDELLVMRTRRGSTKSMRQVFLFQHLVVFTKSKVTENGNLAYVYKDSVKTDDIGITENVGDSGLKFELWFRKPTGDTWVIQANNVKTKNKWVNAFGDLLWDQAMKNRDQRITQQTSLGLGGKPNLDLRESENNIQSRSIKRSISMRLSKRVSAPDLVLTAHNASLSDQTDNVSVTSSSVNTDISDRSKSQSRWQELATQLKNGFSFRDSITTKLYRPDSKLNRTDSGISSLSSQTNSQNYRRKQSLTSMFFNKKELLEECE